MEVCEVATSSLSDWKSLELIFVTDTALVGYFLLHP